jgi:membrane protein implicated in regulation of membrane protease activity
MDSSEVTPQTAQIEGETDSVDSMSPEQRKAMIWTIIAFVVLMLITIAALVFLFSAEAETVERIRDVFIIFMAIQSILTGFVLVILIVQLARLINLMQNEIKPILYATNETISTLRGTTEFLSENLTEPVIKMNEYLAGFTQLLVVLGLMRKKSKPKSTKE